MKKNLLSVLIISMIALSISACEDKKVIEEDLIIDWYPITLDIFIINYNNDVNFIQENTNDIIHKVSLTYKGNTYKISENISKAYMPDFQGLYIDSNAVQRPHLSFGELDGAYDYDDDFIIQLPDNTQEIIHFKRVHKDGVNVDDQWFFNDEKYDKPTFYIRRDQIIVNE